MTNNNIDLKQLKMSEGLEEKPLLASSGAVVESTVQDLASPPRTFSSSSTQSDPTSSRPSPPSVTRATHTATFSTSPRSTGAMDQNLAPGGKQKKNPRRDRVTWGGGKDEDGHLQPPQVGVAYERSQTVQVPNGRGTSTDGARHLDLSRSPRHYQEYVPGGGMYVLYEDGVDSNQRRGAQSPVSYGGEYSIQTERRSSGTSRTRDTNTTFIGEIDGRFSFSEGNVNDYVRVENVNIDSTSTSQELLKCKKTVLKPYLIFLKLIGWRRIKESHQELNRNRVNQCCNVLYPLIIFLMLFMTSVSQLLTCYFRDEPAYFPEAGESWLLVRCESHIVLIEVIPVILILSAYLYGVYIFRYGEPEHLAALMETVFLSSKQEMGKNKKRNIIFVLRVFLVFGGLWIVFDVALNVLRLFSLQLLEETTFIKLLTYNMTIDSSTDHTPGENIARYFFVIFACVGFVFFDLLYFAVVITYVSQNQLIQYYIDSIIDKVRAKAYSLEDAVKEIRYTYNYLQVINSKLATLTTLVMFIFIGAVLSSVYNLTLFPDTLQVVPFDEPIYALGIIVGIGNIIQWSVLALAPLIQAARLTARCRKLRRLGLEIGSRPFVYSGTPQLLVDSFVQYTNATRYTAKLASVPIYPSYIVGILFLGGIIGCFIVGLETNYFTFAPWF